MKTVGLKSMGEALDDVGEVEHLSKSTKADRWDWKKTVSLLPSMVLVLANSLAVEGVHQQPRHQKQDRWAAIPYHEDVIARKSRSQYEHVDPLKDVPKEILKESRLDFGG